MTFGMRTGEVIGWEPAEAGSFYSVFIFFLIHVNFLMRADYHGYGNIESVRWEFTLEAFFTKYLFCIECLKCSSSVRYQGFLKNGENVCSLLFFLPSHFSLLRSLLILVTFCSDKHWLAAHSPPIIQILLLPFTVFYSYFFFSSNHVCQTD